MQPKMRFIISPAKKMNVADDMFAWRDLPRLLPQTEQILDKLRTLSYEELKAVWKCSDKLAVLNYERVRNMSLLRGLSPAVFSYEGIQYQHLAPQVMTADQLEYLQEHLRILSGFYGVLRPFDGVTPYRLEMQANLPVAGAKDLYDFWGSQLFDTLREEAPVIVNLASVEYAKAIEGHVKRAALSGDRDVSMVTCLFGTLKDGKLIQRSTEAKAARGSFVRWCAENQVESPGEFVKFDVMGYRYNGMLSTKYCVSEKLVFVKES